MSLFVGIQSLNSLTITAAGLIITNKIPTSRLRNEDSLSECHDLFPLRRVIGIITLLPNGQVMSMN
jgi:hypothetical protein